MKLSFLKEKRVQEELLCYIKYAQTRELPGFFATSNCAVASDPSQAWIVASRQRGFCIALSGNQ
ncbi:unnamed protein product [Rhodiola kirilowii]